MFPEFEVRRKSVLKSCVNLNVPEGGSSGVRLGISADHIRYSVIESAWFGNITEKYMNFELCVMLGG